jgi:hypothetical protein
MPPKYGSEGQRLAPLNVPRDLSAYMDSDSLDMDERERYMRMVSCAWALPLPGMDPRQKAPALPRDRISDILSPGAHTHLCRGPTCLASLCLFHSDPRGYHDHATLACTRPALGRDNLNKKPQQEQEQPEQHHEWQCATWHRLCSEPIL